MASLFRSRQSFLQLNAWDNASLNGLHYNTSVQGSVITLVYGTTRVQANLLDFGDYKGPSGSKGKTGSLPVGGTQSRTGKGGSSKSGKKSAPDYTVDVALEVAQGPIVGIGNVYTSAGIADFTTLPLNFYSGADGQAADPTFVALGDIVGYSGTAYVTGTPLDLGPSPVLPNIGVEVLGFLIGINTGSFTSDANPANIITDFLTNTRYGAQFPPANLDDLTTLTGMSYAEYCQAAQLLVSVALDGHQKAIEWLGAIAKLTNTAMFFSGKLLKFKPYGDLALTVNGTTWTPNLVPEYELTDFHFLPWRQHEPGREPTPGEDDPILVTRSNQADADNWLSIEYTDRLNFYNSTTLTVNDQGNTDTFGLRIGDSINGRAFCVAASAQISAQLVLQRKTVIRNTPYKIQVGWQFARLEPMDIILLTGRYADLYLAQQPVRILSIEEDNAGGLTIEAEELQTGASAPPLPPPGPPPVVIAYANSPGTQSPHFVLRSTTLSIPDDPYVISTGAQKESILVLMVETRQDGVLAAPTVSGIVSTPALTWHHRTSYAATAFPGTVASNMEIWWADVSALTSGTAVTPTVTFSGTAYLAQLNIRGIAQVGNPASPWDPNGSLPTKVTGMLVPPAISGVSTTRPNTIVLVWITTPYPMAYVGPNGGMTLGSPPFGVAPLSSITNDGNVFAGGGADEWMAAYVSFTTLQNSLLLKPCANIVNSVVPPYSTVGYLMIADAIVGL